MSSFIALSEGSIKKCSNYAEKRLLRVSQSDHSIATNRRILMIVLTFIRQSASQTKDQVPTIDCEGRKLMVSKYQVVKLLAKINANHKRNRIWHYFLTLDSEHASLVHGIRHREYVGERHQLFEISFHPGWGFLLRSLALIRKNETSGDAIFHLPHPRGTHKVKQIMPSLSYQTNRRLMNLNQTRPGRMAFRETNQVASKPGNLGDFSLGNGITRRLANCNQAPQLVLPAMLTSSLSTSITIWAMSTSVDSEIATIHGGRRLLLSWQ